MPRHRRGGVAQGRAPWLVIMAALSAVASTMAAMPAQAVNTRLIYPPRAVDLSPSGPIGVDVTGQNSSGRSIAVAQSGSTVYAAAQFGGLFKSSDSGANWSQLTSPIDSRYGLLAGGLPGPVVLDVSADPTDPSRVLAVSARNDSYRTTSSTGLYLSTDGGASWSRVYNPAACSLAGAAPEGVTFYGPRSAIAWGGCELAQSVDGGQTWSRVRTFGFHVFQASLSPSGAVWACGQGTAGGAVAMSGNINVASLWQEWPAPLPQGIRGTFCAGNNEQEFDGVNSAWRGLAINPAAPYLAYVTVTGVGPAQLLRVNVGDPNNPTFWPLLVPGPTATASGAATVLTRAHSGGQSGFFMVFGNEDELYAIEGEPPLQYTYTALDPWYRLGAGKMHVDTHAFALDPGLDMQLRTGVDGTVVGRCPTTLPMFAANDGGVYRSTDCGATWTAPQSGLSTLAVNYFAMVPRPNAPVELGFGVGDDGDFMSFDGGGSWSVPGGSDCGDCGDWFSDPLNPTWAVTFARATSGVRVRTFDATTNSSATLDNRLLGQVSYYTPDAPSPNRPVVQTMPGEAGTTTRDLVWVSCCEVDTGMPALYRSANIGDSRSDRQLTLLPAGNWFVQPSGGHVNTHYFLWNQVNKSLWRWAPGGQMTQLVPGPGATQADRFWVNPYDPNDVTIVDSDGTRDGPGIKRLGSHGWNLDSALTSLVTNNGEFTMGCSSFPGCLVNDMKFVGDEHTRFIAGKSGVFVSRDAHTWSRLFSTDQIPGSVSGLAFDTRARSLYVGINSRGLLRFDGVACLHASSC